MPHPLHVPDTVYSGRRGPPLHVPGRVLPHAGRGRGARAARVVAPA